MRGFEKVAAHLTHAKSHAPSEIQAAHGIYYIKKTTGIGRLPLMRELSAKLTEGETVDGQSLRHGKPCHLPLHKGG